MHVVRQDTSELSEPWLCVSVIQYSRTMSTRFNCCTRSVRWTPERFGNWPRMQTAERCVCSWWLKVKCDRRARCDLLGRMSDFSCWIRLFVIRRGMPYKWANERAFVVGGLWLSIFVFGHMCVNRPNECVRHSLSVALAWCECDMCVCVITSRPWRKWWLSQTICGPVDVCAVIIWCNDRIRRHTCAHSCVCVCVCTRKVWERAARERWEVWLQLTSTHISYIEVIRRVRLSTRCQYDTTLARLLLSYASHIAYTYT